jgi:hypothetical protein
LALIGLLRLDCQINRMWIRLTGKNRFIDLDRAAGLYSVDFIDF